MSASRAERLAFHSMPEPNSGCLLWTGRSDTDGYGVVSVNGQRVRASRAAWMEHRGPIPDGMQVLHKCDVRACINPNHLFLGTRTDNMADMARKGRCPSFRGEQHPQAKLTNAQRAAIRADGRVQRVIASEYGIAPSLVSRIKHEVKPMECISKKCVSPRLCANPNVRCALV